MIPGRRRRRTSLGQSIRIDSTTAVRSIDLLHNKGKQEGKLPAMDFGEEKDGLSMKTMSGLCTE